MTRAILLISLLVVAGALGLIVRWFYVPLPSGRYPTPEPIKEDWEDRAR
jgi:hypothetical protein